MAEWQPIETAPKVEGARILILQSGFVDIASWHVWRVARPVEIRDDGSWVGDHDWPDDEYEIFHPTHWQPLPPPQKEQE